MDPTYFCRIGSIPVVDPASAGLIDIWGLNMVITVPADVLAPLGARTSAGIVMTMMFIHY